MADTNVFGGCGGGGDGGGSGCGGGGECGSGGLVVVVEGFFRHGLDQKDDGLDYERNESFKFLRI